MKHTTYKNSIILAIFFCLVHGIAFVSPAGPGSQPLTILPESVSIVAYAGDFAEVKITVTNNLDRDADIVVHSSSSIIGDISDVMPHVDGRRMRVAPGESTGITLKGYIEKEANPGLYAGEVILNVDGISQKVPISLEITEPVDMGVSITLEIKPGLNEIKPGSTLSVTSKINKKGEKDVHALLEVLLIDPDTNQVIVKNSMSFDVAPVMDMVLELHIPTDIAEKTYSIEGILSYTVGDAALDARDSAEVCVRGSVFDIFSQGFALLTEANILLVLVLFAVIITLYLFYTRYYTKEKDKKKRYLKSISFKTLPRAGSRSVFVGRIAETSDAAFINLDSAQTHVMIAGATGCGKTVAAEIVVEEALMKGISVIVFDPTAQWSGFLHPNKDRTMFKLYKPFHMKKSDARAFNGNIHIVNDPNERINIKKYMNGGDIAIFCLNKLNPSEIETFIGNTINEIREADLEESQRLETLLVYDEIHRLLPKFGGSGKGLLQIEQSVREFRKWGVGILLISQVLSDFVGEIKANIGTEIQMHTKYDNDLKRIKLKYGEDMFKSVVKANVGTGMIQNPEYNKGMPYFISFRPLLHNLTRLSDEELELYAKYNNKIIKLEGGLDSLIKENVDVFDLELELKLARDSIKKGEFGVVDLYLESLTPKIDDYLTKLKNKEIKEEDLAISSEWEKNKGTLLRKYEVELGSIIEKGRKGLEEKEKRLMRVDEDMAIKLDLEKKELLAKEQRITSELNRIRRKLDTESQVLDLLGTYGGEQKKLKGLTENIINKERKKLKTKGTELELNKTKRETELTEKKKDAAEREEKAKKELRIKETELRSELKSIKQRWGEIESDKLRIIKKDKELTSDEEKLKTDLKTRIMGGIKRREGEIKSMMKRTGGATPEKDMSARAKKGDVVEIDTVAEIVKTESREKRMELIRFPTHRWLGTWVFVNPAWVTHLGTREDGNTDVHLVKKEEGLPQRVTVTMNSDDVARCLAGRKIPGFRADGGYVALDPQRYSDAH